jgi:hypothetical protein
MTSIQNIISHHNINAAWGSNFWCPGKDVTIDQAIRGAKALGITVLVIGPRGGIYGRDPTKYQASNLNIQDYRPQIGAITYLL